MNGSRLSGIVLSIIGLGIAVIAGLFLASQVSAGDLSGGGALVGAMLAFIPVALLLGFGVYLFLRGGSEAKETSTMQQQRRILDIVKSRGQVAVADLALEVGVPVNTIQDLVHQLVGLQVFSGYVNWQEGVLYSDDASKLRDLTKCKNCGGDIVLVGKGTVVCKFCGTEYFLT